MSLTLMQIVIGHKQSLKTQPSQCHQPLALLQGDTVQCSQLAEKREKKWLEVPCTGGTKVPGWVNGQNHPM